MESWRLTVTFNSLRRLSDYFSRSFECSSLDHVGVETAHLRVPLRPLIIQDHQLPQGQRSPSSPPPCRSWVGLQEGDEEDGEEGEDDEGLAALVAVVRLLFVAAAVPWLNRRQNCGRRADVCWGRSGVVVIIGDGFIFGHVEEAIGGQVVKHWPRAVGQVGRSGLVVVFYHRGVY